jgi:hypothetical protein
LASIARNNKYSTSTEVKAKYGQIQKVWLSFFRHQQKNLILAGVHSGYKKPKLRFFFRHIFQLFSDLEKSGVVIGKQKFNIRFGAGILDGPARCLVLGFRQFNWSKVGVTAVITKERKWERKKASQDIILFEKGI